jgi:copper chaperone
MEKTVLKVEGMSCSHCVQAVEGALREIGAKGEVDLESGTVQVEYDNARLSLQQIKDAIEEQGYTVV